MPIVLNKRKVIVPPTAIDIDAGTMWEMPFMIGKDGSRAEVLMMHGRWFFQQEELLCALPSLAGHDLVCACSPRPCHGDLLLWLANMDAYARRKIIAEFVH